MEYLVVNYDILFMYTLGLEYYTLLYVYSIIPTS